MSRNKDDTVRSRNFDDKIRSRTADDLVRSRNGDDQVRSMQRLSKTVPTISQADDKSARLAQSIARSKTTQVRTRGGNNQQFPGRTRKYQAKNIISKSDVKQRILKTAMPLERETRLIYNDVKTISCYN